MLSSVPNKTPYLLVLSGYRPFFAANIQPDPTKVTCEIAPANQILRATSSMHGVANQTEKRNKRFASEKMTDLLRWLEKSSVKDGKIGPQQFISNGTADGSYRHVISLCCSEGGKNTAKHGKKDLC